VIGGALLGGSAGSFLGDSVVEVVVERHYHQKLQKLDEDFRRFVYAQYGIR